MLLEDAPKGVQVHLLQHALVACLQRQLTLLLDLEGIGRAGVVQVVGQRRNEGEEPLLLREAAPKCL